MTNDCTLFVVLFSGAAGFVRNAVLSNVRCKYIEAEGCVLINVTAERIIARPGSIIYNVIAEAGSGNKEVLAGEGDVTVGVFAEDGSQLVVRSHMDTDGGECVCCTPIHFTLQFWLPFHLV